MHLSIIVSVILVNGFAITFSRDVDPFASACIYQVTSPAARCLNTKDKTISLCVIETYASHFKVGGELTTYNLLDQFFSGSKEHISK